MLALEHPQRRGSVVSFQDLVAQVPQGFRDHTPDQGLILDQQHGCRFGSGRSKPERTCRHRTLRHTSPLLLFTFLKRFSGWTLLPLCSGFPESSFQSRTEDFFLPAPSEQPKLLRLGVVTHDTPCSRGHRASGKGRAQLGPALVHGTAVQAGTDLAFMPGRADTAPAGTMAARRTDDSGLGTALQDGTPALSALSSAEHFAGLTLAAPPIPSPLGGYPTLPGHRYGRAQPVP